MKYFKMVSGKGKIPMSQKEISELFKEADLPECENPSQLERLEEKVEALSKVVEEISKIDIFKALSALTERVGKNDGAS